LILNLKYYIQNSIVNIHNLYLLLHFNIMIFKTCKVILNSSKSVIFRFNSNFVPKHLPVQSTDANTLHRFIKEHKKILVLTGRVYHKWLI